MAEGESRGTGIEDIVFVLLILGGLAIAWYISGGPAREGAGEQKPFLLSPVQIGSPSNLSPLVDLGGGEDTSYRSEVESASSDVARINDEVAKAGDPGARSPFYGQVVFANSTSGIGASSANDEYITVRAASGNGGSVTITGWTVRSAMTGHSATIPGGAKIPVTGSVNHEDPIVLAPGDEAVLSSGRSPVGVSFKENRCTGYFSQFQSFTPSLNSQCPRPDNEVSFSQSSIGNDNRCLDFLESMGSCRIEVSPLPDDLSSDCRSFIANQVNYNSCVINHRGEPSFLSNTWRVYLRYDSPLWKERREVLKLLDSQGKTVDVFTY